MPEELKLLVIIKKLLDYSLNYGFVLCITITSKKHYSTNVSNRSKMCNLLTLITNILSM